jgi:hypothetical protein
MTPSLPPLRDLPFDRQAEIRTELVRAMDRPTRRPWFIPALAAAATAAVVALAVIVLLPGDSPTFVPPAGQRDNPLELPPGITPAERSKIEQLCATKDPAGNGYRLYNALSDDLGTFAILIRRADSAECAFPHDPAERYGAMTIEMAPDEVTWLPGAMRVDTATPADSFDGKPAANLAVGRVSSEVASVRMTIGAETVEAVVVNGTFIARMIHPGTPPPSDARVHLDAYDAEGNLVDSQDTIPPAHSDECYTVPDGRYMTGDGMILPDVPAGADLRDCPPATPWR